MPRKQNIAGRCCLPPNLKVWKETCGGCTFMKIGMLSYWKDKGSPLRLQQAALPPDRCYSGEKYEAFMELINKELKEGFITKVDRSQVKYCSPTFPVERKKSRERKASRN
jgi:hypothetical protein